MMKRLLLSLLLCLPMLAMAQNKVAVYVSSSADGVDDAMKEIIGSELVNAIVNTNKYLAVERTADFLRQIMNEQGYQRTGKVDEQQLSKLGKQFGVDYVCVANVMTYKESFYVQARMIDVETATVKAIAREISNLSDLDEIINAASKVAHDLVSPDEPYEAPIQTVATPKGAVKSSKKPQPVSAISVKVADGEIIRYSLSERKMFGYPSYVYGKTEMDRKAMAQFLQNNCLDAYVRYYRGQQKITSGWSLFGVGCAFVFMGGMCFLDEDYRGNSTDEGLISGGFFSGVGGAAVLTGSVLLPFGYKQRDHAYEIYNATCANKKARQYSLELQSSSNGLGLAFKF